MNAARRIGPPASSTEERLPGMSSKPTISGTWSNPAARRCDPKQVYIRIKAAELAAKKASEETGDLIIAYQCPDCGRFHIGHADSSQRLARKAHMDRPCQQCGGMIPAYKKEKAARRRSTALYCSDGCQRRAAGARRQARKAVIDNAHR